MNENISPSGIYYRTSTFVASRPTLVFVHGVSGSSSAWEHYEERFGANYNILTFDLRGHGKSKKYRSLKDYVITKFVEDMEELLDLLQINHFILITHSFGTNIALEYLSRHSDHVSAVIFLSPTYHLRRRKIVSLVELLVDGGIAVLSPFPFHPGPGRHIDYARYLHSGDWNIPRMIRDISNTTLRIYLFCLRDLHKYKDELHWKSITQPTLIVHGKKDSISPYTSAVAIHKEILNSELVAIEQGNHIIVLNNFQEVSHTIQTFISRQK